MKLQYFYFDFTENGEKPEGYRGFRVCELNFGTSFRYHMEPPTEGRNRYLLTRQERPEHEKIEPGFWGDERLYNISALVGDNGAGKSTLIHEMIRCLTACSYGADADDLYVRPQYPYAFVAEDEMQQIHVVSSRMEIIEDSFAEEGKHSNARTGDSRDHGNVTKKTKIIYFSNAVTMADKRQYDLWGNSTAASPLKYSGLSPYVRQLFDCSLIADMSEAIKSSERPNSRLRQPWESEPRRELGEFLDMYFNFRSYQEARYVFDREQRKILLKLRKDDYVPVPFPKRLRLTIENFAHTLYTLHDSQGINLTHTFLEQCGGPDTSLAQQIAAVLSMNCVMMYYDLKNCSVTQNAVPEWRSWKEPGIYMDLLRNVSGNWVPAEKTYLRCCESYIAFLWENIPTIQDYFEGSALPLWQMNHITTEIPLGDQIDRTLEAFMIQFVNLTRAVSEHRYFVVYNWGLSSGESNLLHMFTKLRYALWGRRYDAEEYRPEDKTKAQKDAVSAGQMEELLSITDDQTIHVCDSVILFFDEADMTYHPEWQRRFVSILTEFLPKLYKDPYYVGSGSGCKEIQVILSTHSPLMLGDFPSASVIYLRKDESGANCIADHRQPITFGDNLYAILRDGFYLKNGAVGEFARRKIEEVLKDTSEIRKQTNDGRFRNEWTAEAIERKLNRLEAHEKKTVRYLARGIIRSKLEEEIENCRHLLLGVGKKEPLPSANEEDNLVRIRQLEREKAILEQKIRALTRKAEVSE